MTVKLDIPSALAEIAPEGLHVLNTIVPDFRSCADGIDNSSRRRGDA
jgi:hypothetical protein